MARGIGQESSLWRDLNQRLLAKTLSELHYEECFKAEGRDEYWSISLNSGVVYSFCAWESIWGQLRIEPASLQRNGEPATSAAQFYIDAKKELCLDDIVLGNALEECAQTLYADQLAWQRREDMTAADIAAMDVDAMQPYLDGHPKAVLNKGRMGWGSEELNRYTPESAQAVRFRWIALRKDRCRIGQSDDWRALLATAMPNDQLAALFTLLERQVMQADDWVIIPVHPWQWQHKIVIHFQEWISEGALIDLGEWGYRYLPLQSIRTLSNLDHPSHPNIKLPVTILNTSCYRGIPGRYIEVGASLSQWLQACCEQDALLSARGTEVLREPFGVSCCHDRYQQIAEAPYRYHEMLGVIWRDSVQSKLRGSEHAMLMAALLQSDHQGVSVVEVLIERSGWAAPRWLKALFDAVVVPLYHLMCRYGVGLVAHGQNITLLLEDSVPKRLAIKDLQGDLRIVDQPFEELQSLPEAVQAVLTKLPPQYLIHDLQTGHFVTVLRYLSALMQERNVMNEESFYAILATTLREYQQAHPELAERFEQFDLLEQNIKRVCINRVRFLEGYGDRPERPLPILGTDLINPLWRATASTQQETA